MGVFKYAINILSFRIDLGIFLIVLPFFMIGFLFLAVLYLTLKLWISDIILKFLMEVFTGEIVDIKDCPKKDRNRMNRYISICFILLFITSFIMNYLSLDTNNTLYYIIQISIVIVTVGLVYKNIKRLKK